MKLSLAFLMFLLSLSGACTQNRDSASRSFVQSNTQTANTPTALRTEPKANTAIVISPHANLRETDSVRAAVLEVVPQDSSVEVIKQQGAWFLVKTETVQGWMHGNTLKLQSFDINPPTTQSRMQSRMQSKPPPKYTPEPEINNSGATAKCRDGTLSYSAHRRGTCSHHGGVAVWY